MKRMFQFILPVLAFVLASAAAMNSVEPETTSKTGAVVLQGFIQNPTQFNCLPTEVDCTTVNTGQICMSSDATPRQVWLKNAANACNVTLYKVIE
jgi:hypothetical protein